MQYNCIKSMSNENAFNNFNCYFSHAAENLRFAYKFID